MVVEKDKDKDKEKVEEEGNHKMIARMRRRKGG